MYICDKGNAEEMKQLVENDKDYVYAFATDKEQNTMLHLLSRR